MVRKEEPFSIRPAQVPPAQGMAKLHVGMGSSPEEGPRALSVPQNDPAGIWFLLVFQSLSL